MSTFTDLQREVGEWSERNFGDQPVVNPLLGVSEEFGELMEHIEKHDSLTEHELDCIGDMLVYMADFCYRRGLDFQTAYDTKASDNVDYENPLNGVNAALGYLNRSVLKRRQGIRLDEPRIGDKAEQQAIARFLDHISDFARTRGFTLEECIRVAWYEEVVNREWDSSYVEG